MDGRASRGSTPASVRRRRGGGRSGEDGSKWSMATILIICLMIMSAGVFISVALHLHFDVVDHVQEDGHGGVAKE